MDQKNIQKEQLINKINILIKKLEDTTSSENNNDKIIETKSMIFLKKYGHFDESKE